MPRDTHGSGLPAATAEEVSAAMAQLEHLRHGPVGLPSTLWQICRGMWQRGLLQDGVRSRWRGLWGQLRKAAWDYRVGLFRLFRVSM